MLGLILGSAASALSIAGPGTDGPPAVVMRRHADPDRPDDPAGFIPAHRVDHHRTMTALRDAGVTHVVSVNSVGSLRTDLPVGTVVIPDDFYAPTIAPSFFDDARGHRVPGFDTPWRAQVIAAWQAHAAAPAVSTGTYAHTSGPRFETPAEVRALAQVADIVGMTVGAECILAGEADLAYAAVCMVDNLGNGLDPDGTLTLAAYEAGKAANHAELARVVAAVINDLAPIVAAPQPPGPDPKD